MAVSVRGNGIFAEAPKIIEIALAIRRDKVLVVGTVRAKSPQAAPLLLNAQS